MRHRNNCQHIQNNQEYLFGTNCSTCGTLTNYADDTTLMCASNSRTDNQAKLIEGLDNIDNYLTANKLAINRTKMPISEIMIGQKRVRTEGLPPTLTEMETDGKQKIIRSQPDVRLLGATISDNITWGAHMETGGNALLPGTRKTLGILKHIGRSIPKKSKKNISGRIDIKQNEISHIHLGRDHLENFDQSQTLLNDTARFVTNRNRRTSTIDLMSECGWLTVLEMIQHCSLLLMWKTLRLNSPKGMKDKLSMDHENLITTQEPRL